MLEKVKTFYFVNRTKILSAVIGAVIASCITYVVFDQLEQHEEEYFHIPEVVQEEAANE